MALFCWERHGKTDVLVMACAGTNGEVEAIALQPGPIDENSLILRAGPDAPLLRTLRATLFGAGALGRYVQSLQTGLLDNGMDPKGVNLVRIVLSGAMKHTLNLEMILRNPVPGAKAPPDPEPRGPGVAH